MAVIVGLDLGSTGGKFATSTGLVDSIPAVVGEAGDLWQWERDYIRLGNQFVGRAAMEQAEVPIFALENDKTRRKTVEQVLQAVLAYIVAQTGEDVLDVVATLPFDASAGQKELLLKMLDSVSGKRIQATIGGEQVAPVINIRRKHLIPEGFAGYCNYILDDAGEILRKELARQTVHIGDLGLFHFNQLVVKAMVPQGKPVSRSSALGLSVAHLAASRILGGISTWKVDRKIVAGEYDASAIFEKYAQAVNQEVLNLEARQGSKFPFYYWTGGGAVAAYSWLDQPKKQLAEDGQMDNALGALKVAKRRWLRDV